MTLKHELSRYLRAAYLFRSKGWEKSVGYPFPVTPLRWNGLRVTNLGGIARGNFTEVTVTALDHVVAPPSDHYEVVKGTGFAKRSFDVYRIERGVAIALDRALDDLLCGMVRREIDARRYDGERTEQGAP